MKRQTLWLGVLAAVLFACSARADIRIVLNDSFIDQFKDRMSISACFSVDEAKGRANSPSKDGDLHMAGRSPYSHRLGMSRFYASV
jgi:hypothetical protein